MLLMVLNLINELLKYFRVNTRGKEFIEIDCNEIVEKVMRDLQLLIEENNCKISYDKLPKVCGDEKQLKQLFQNLITNGIKFNDKEQAEIDSQVQTDQKVWRFSVSDNGIGIENEYQK
ncbi:histidine kinase/DNA gyrase B/HSP90-like ATPase [Orenia metallireducens]|uniref:histidine kinase n=1 Tax=Orenia metallireducens TaxID=1413210 RepID=A0A285GPQ3_9FIRM|nr:histidine kinase/DNA gyrase B/HSP90-like ATPase [Orenia metallireducens]SNY25610.1 Histidine kinase-, DNA gyrase B-, and HSP90-like ATPase [Orenia metallireducens]